MIKINRNIKRKLWRL